MPMNVDTDHIKGHRGHPQEDYQHTVIDVFLCIVTGWAGDRCMSLNVLKKVSMVHGQQDDPRWHAPLVVNLSY